MSRVFFFLVLFVGPLSAQEKTLQVFGTQAFLTVPADTYFDPKRGLIEIPSERISITGFAFDRDVDEQYSSFESENGYKALAYPGVSNRILLAGTSKFDDKLWLQQVVLMLGDHQEAVSIIFAFPTAKEEIKVSPTVAQIMRGAYLDKTSPTNWEKLSFFDDSSLSSLRFSGKKKNALVFARKGLLSANSFAVVIGQASFSGDFLENKLPLLQKYYENVPLAELSLRTGEVNSRAFVRASRLAPGYQWKERIVTLIRVHDGYFSIDGYLQEADREAQDLYDRIVENFRPFRETIDVQ